MVNYESCSHGGPHHLPLLHRQPPAHAPQQLHLARASSSTSAAPVPVAVDATPRKTADYKVVLVTYADGEPFTTSQRLLATTAGSIGGIDGVITWNKRRLNATAWGQRHLAGAMRANAGGGCTTCSWKPFLILDALEALRPNDFVVYADSSRYFHKGFERSVLPLTNALHADAAGALQPPLGALGMVPGLRMRQRNNARINWRTKKSTRPHSDSKLRRCDLCGLLVRMGLCAPDANASRSGGTSGGELEACCNGYLHAPHVQNSYSVWQRSETSLAFVRQWLAYNEDHEVVARARYGDQSIVTLMAVRWSLLHGLRVPYLAAAHAPTCGELAVVRRACQPATLTPHFALLIRDPGALLAAAAGVPQGAAVTATATARRPTPLFFLGHADPYPECAAAAAAGAAEPRGVQCTWESHDHTLESPAVPPWPSNGPAVPSAMTNTTSRHTKRAARKQETRQAPPPPPPQASSLVEQPLYHWPAGREPTAPYRLCHRGGAGARLPGPRLTAAEQPLPTPTPTPTPTPKETTASTPSGPGAKVAPYRVLFLSYAEGEPFASTQRQLVATAKTVGGADEVDTWNWARLNATAWAAEHLQRPAKAWGRVARWAWKPFLILNALEALRPGDFVFYADSSKYFRKGFERSVLPLTNALHADAAGALQPPLGALGMVPGLRLPQRNSNGGAFNGRNVHGDHHNKVRRCDLCDILWHVGLCRRADEKCCDLYFHSPSVQASYSVWQVNPHVLRFVRTWKAACQDFGVLSRAKWGDQSVLGLIVTWFSLHVGLRLPYLSATLGNLTLASDGDCTLEKAKKAEAAVAQRGGTVGYWHRVKACTTAAAERSLAWRSNLQLKDLSELLTRFAGADGAVTSSRGKASELFLTQTDQYPECERGRARPDSPQCGPLPDDFVYRRDV